MPALILSAQQRQIVLDLAGKAAATHSPLHASPPADEEDSNVALEQLVERHIVEAVEEGWRLNHLFASVLAACLDPDEVISLQTMGGRWAGFTACRKGPLVSECTVGVDGAVKFSFPLSRSAVQLSLVAALSADRPEPTPTGFAFRGTPTAAFLLSLLLEIEREGRPRVDQEALSLLARHAVDDPTKTLGLALLAGAEPLLAVNEDEAFGKAIAELGAAGMVVIDHGVLRPTESVLTVLSSPVLASFMVSRCVIEDGRKRTASLNASRVGDRTVIFRASDVNAGRQVEWAEVNRRQLRALVHAVTLDERELSILST